MLIFSFVRASDRVVQLKTWDFVQLSQEEAYGDIHVTAGVGVGVFLVIAACRGNQESTAFWDACVCVCVCVWKGRGKGS